MLETCAAESIDCLRFDAMPPSDDRPFGARKIPTLSMAILPAAEAHQVWLLLHAKGAGFAPGFAPPIFGTIHTPGDVPEKLEASAMATAGRLARGPHSARQRDALSRDGGATNGATAERGIAALPATARRAGSAARPSGRAVLVAQGHRRLVDSQGRPRTG